MRAPQKSQRRDLEFFAVSLVADPLEFYSAASGNAAGIASSYVMAVACWRADREADAWRQFCDLVDIGGKLWQHAQDREPPDLPWLAVHLLPYIAALSPETLMMLGDLERCLAWALIESE